MPGPEKLPRACFVVESVRERADSHGVEDVDDVGGGRRGTLPSRQSLPRCLVKTPARRGGSSCVIRALSGCAMPLSFFAIAAIRQALPVAPHQLGPHAPMLG